jgi:hypothetical protein
MNIKPSLTAQAIEMDQSAIERRDSKSTRA